MCASGSMESLDLIYGLFTKEVMFQKTKLVEELRQDIIDDINVVFTSWHIILQIYQRCYLKIIRYIIHSILLYIFRLGYQFLYIILKYLYRNNAETKLSLVFDSSFLNVRFRSRWMSSCLGLEKLHNLQKLQHIYQHRFHNGHTRS